MCGLFVIVFSNVSKNNNKFRTLFSSIFFDFKRLRSCKLEVEGGKAVAGVLKSNKTIVSIELVQCIHYWNVIFCIQRGYK